MHSDARRFVVMLYGFVLGLVMYFGRLPSCMLPLLCDIRGWLTFAFTLWYSHAMLDGRLDLLGHDTMALIVFAILAMYLRINERILLCAWHLGQLAVASDQLLSLPELQGLLRSSALWFVVTHGMEWLLQCAARRAARGRRHPRLQPGCGPVKVRL